MHSENNTTNKPIALNAQHPCTECNHKYNTHWYTHCPLCGECMVKQTNKQINKDIPRVKLCMCSKCNKVYNAFYHTACPYCTLGVINPLIPLKGRS